jgi:uncharacterized membrane protein YkoI
MTLRSFLIALTALALSAGAAEAQRALWAAPSGGPDIGSRWSPDAARDAVREGRHRPLREIVRAVESQVPGRMVGQAALEERGGGQAVYHIRWLTANGQLLDLVVDAETGAVQR